ncbi:MAG TPA: choice-of-anchor P family protein [Bryobacteraceae bacterium]|nr:choice-of-anchor P family protein [Bryobacteraceae bacterium]
MRTPRFLYHASAVGLAGQVRRPIQRIIDAQASTALPRYGGHSSARFDKFELENILSHDGTATEAIAAYQDSSDTHETSVSATVTGLNIRGVVTVKSLTSKVASSHPASRDEEPRISIAGSEIQGLRIAGRDIVLEPRLDIYSQLDTMTKLGDYYRGNTAFRDDLDAAAYVGRAADLPEDVWPFFPWRKVKRSSTLPQHRGMTIVPLYTVKNPSEPGFEVYGNVVRVHDFGRIHIGELIIESHRRRLLMMHADLGSPVEASFCAGCTDGNGSQGQPPDSGGNGD